MKLNENHPWIKVDKNRFQKKFNIIDNLLVEVSPRNLYFDFAMEITQLKIYRQSWWSIGFDSYLRDNHDHFFIHLIERYMDKQFQNYLKSDASFGYPEWITKVCKP